MPPDEKQAGSRRLWSTAGLIWWLPKSFLALFPYQLCTSSLGSGAEIHTAMNKKQGDCIRDLTSMMYEMDF